ncbi:MAG TPA: 50S ribosomal protein L13 [Thermoplasmata archaeon]|nr:50S ribosomal protein L13 [Thermoplasmata archaeon]
MPESSPEPTPAKRETPAEKRPPKAATRPPRSSPPAGSAPTPPLAPKVEVSAPAVVDASGLVLGRAAGLIAQRLLRGEEIVVIHAERSVVTGARSRVFEEFTARRARGSVRSGPHYPRYPDRIFRRAVRGMLPHLKTRGREALDRLTVHIGCPPEVAAAKSESLEQARARPSLAPPLTLEEISRHLGARL